MWMVVSLRAEGLMIPFIQINIAEDPPWEAFSDSSPPCLILFDFAWAV